MLGLSKITAIFQPHRYTRLKANIDGFKQCFSGADELVVLPVFTAGEEENDVDLKAEFSTATFAERIERKGDFIAFKDSFGVAHILNDGLVIGFGAGDISAQLRGK